MKLHQGGSENRLLFSCPGCNCPHGVIISGNGAWGFNGNMESPTFTPSVLVRYGTGSPHESSHDPKREAICHSYVRNGTIQFLGDCTHHLAGQTVPLPEFKW